MGSFSISVLQPVKRIALALAVIARIDLRDHMRQYFWARALIAKNAISSSVSDSDSEIDYKTC